ncbi:unnamed protein product [Strongylus vulgaris]|uniref:Uncharacterized protein n=1 Tax=Strongylus vulgaris TaxID=40348 RepID=A0A3P7JFE3_STRVU|nr:unnamed protein product [Strongylus vulgaris]
MDDSALLDLFMAYELLRSFPKTLGCIVVDWRPIRCSRSRSPPPMWSWQ